MPVAMFGLLWWVELGEEDVDCKLFRGGGECR